jgi:hypothetical protein
MRKNKGFFACLDDGGQPFDDHSAFSKLPLVATEFGEMILAVADSLHSF